MSVSPEIAAQADRILAGLSPEQIAALREEIAGHISRTKILDYYPDTGTLRRELYPQHMRFFQLGRTHRFRGVLAANRVGKTEGMGGYEVACHAMGVYPNWWPGRVFLDKPPAIWVAGKTRENTRDILQRKLLGDWGRFGTGLIPYDAIDDWRPAQGVAESVSVVWVKHSSGHRTRIAFKSFDQTWRAFEGTEQDIIWLDEESEELIRAECVKRLMTTNGMLIETFTPLQGLTPIVMGYMPTPEVDAGEEQGFNAEAVETVSADKALVRVGWDDVPHLTEEQKRSTLAETPPYLHDAVSKGIPSLGAGAIYPVPESEIKVAPFAIPRHWPVVYALDVGWNRTAAIWGAWDRDTDTVYLYAEHYRGQAEPAIHATAIRAKGDWIHGVIDPAARGRTQKDGEKLIDTYRENGLVLTPAQNAVETGLVEVWQRLSTGRLKVFSSLGNFWTEYRMYRRDEKGRIVKAHDHLMDATRYLIMSGLKKAMVQPVDTGPVGQPWQPLDSVVGY